MLNNHSDNGADSGERPQGVVKLSPEEAAVVSQLALGLSNREIARTLGKPIGTVKNQLARVYRKLGVRSRLRLMVLFRP